LNPDDLDSSNHDLSVCVLASGSRGNCVYLDGGGTAILIDAGLSGIELTRRMAARGLDPEQLNAIVVSHEHSDHINGVGVLSRRYKIPVYASRKTADAAHNSWGKLSDLVHFECGRPFSIENLTLRPFSLSHDAADPAGFTISRNGTKIGLATDLGIATAMVKSHLKACTALILEANHDPEMLINGPYPWHLKQRIKGRSGHLSNVDTRELLHELVHDGLRQVLLAHLSEKNNTHKKAARAVESAVGQRNISVRVTRQDRPSELFKFQL
jgi:phosphoribosyl 1,2-cyclic phosphodiesterase